MLLRNLEAILNKMDNFEKYPAYKDSGEFWLGEVPQHWETKKLKHLFFEKKKKNNPELSCGAISFGTVVSKDDEKIPESTKASYQEVLKGDFLVNPLNLNYDLKSLRIALSDIDVVVSSGYIVLNNNAVIHKSYYKWLLHRYDVAYMKLLGSGVRQTISFTHIADSILVYPPLPEQTSIAAFLDEKTAKIDTAIAQKQQMISLLKERKQILIKNAVTKGINPAATMKDSGVEWIGEIPTGWEILPNKVLFQESKVGGDDSLPLLSVSLHTGVSSGELDEEENIRGKVKIEDKSCYKLVKPHYITYNMMRAWQGAIGAVSVEGMVSPAYVVAIPNVKIINTVYFEYQYRTGSFIQQMNRFSKGITDFRKRLYWNEFKQLFTIIPPLPEQTAIVDFITTQSAKIDTSISLQQQQIAKLKEYKATLIDSAVTGKIKVCQG